MNKSQKISKYRKWKKNHDRRQMLCKVNFCKQKSSDRRNNKPRVTFTTSNNISIDEYEHVFSPRNFSLIDNIEEVLGFIDQVRGHYKHKHPVFIRLENVLSLGNGAILLLLANMIQFRSHGIHFNGSIPNDDNLEKKLRESGFFKHLYRTVIARDDYSVGTPDSIIYTHAQKEVDAELADLIVEKASQVVWGEKRRCPGIQRLLIELMHNTNNHAGKKKGTKHWWLSSHKDEINKTVTISFMDFGRGIFDSLDNKQPGDIFYGWKDAFFSYFPFADTSDKIMKLILEGELHKTCTKDYFRGKGLPGIYEAFKSGRIGKLKIISNRVYADVENNDYRLMKHNMHGTFISCEINEYTYNLVW